MKKRVGKILFWLCIVVCVLGVAYIAIYYFRKDKNEDVYQKVQKQVEEKKQEEDAEDEIPIDFASLKETNPDIYAWIEIPDTNVNYPIVQSADDDSYYLNHTIDGQEGYPGSIYTEKVNAKDFSDFNTVIYGHDMKDGSMFRKLEEYKDKDFWKENPYFYIYTPDGNVATYQIYSVGVVKDTSEGYTYQFADDAAFASFLEATKASSLYDTGVEVGNDSQIVTLSTCTREGNDDRTIVHGVRVNVQPAGE